MVSASFRKEDQDAPGSRPNKAIIPGDALPENVVSMAKFDVKRWELEGDCTCILFVECKFTFDILLIWTRIILCST